MDIWVERTVDRPAPEVFGFLSDAANNPTWQHGMVECRWTSPPPIQVGSTYEQTARFMGRPVVSVFAVTAFEPGARIDIETVESTFPIRVTRIVEPVAPERCRVRARISGGPTGLWRLLAPLTDRLARRSIEADYDRLVEYFSSRG